MRLPASYIDLMTVIMATFLLMFALSMKYVLQAQEVILPPIDLTQVRPGAAADGVSERKRIVITINREDDRNTYYLDDEQVSLDKMQVRLEQSRPYEVGLRVDGDVSHRDEFEVIYICHTAGVSEVLFFGEAAKEGISK